MRVLDLFISAMNIKMPALVAGRFTNNTIQLFLFRLLPLIWGRLPEPTD